MTLKPPIFQPAEEGTCLLYDGLTGQILFGTNPLKRIQDVHLFNKNPLIGYLAYPNPTLKNEIPDQLFYEYDRLHVTSNIFPVIPSASEESHRATKLPLNSYEPLGEISRFTRNDMGYKTSGRLEQSVTKAQYLKKIHQIKELLAEGEVYQINYAIRFRKKFKGNPYALFCRLAQTNPAAFSAYLNGGDFQIVSASPERLFRVHGGTITTQPIKGTVSKAGGRRALEQLIKSEKERAELDMITDLERNDIGKVCEHGTVKLKKERAVMELPNMWHTYSEVQGRLRPNVRLADAFDALFPGGSITGCPKLRAMEYIEKLESLPRNIFTGSIGYVIRGERSAVSSKLSSIKLNPYRLPLNTDFNIAIRTALIHHGLVEYWAGGGIVFDSDPEKEYEECMLKAEKFLKLI